MLLLYVPINLVSIVAYRFSFYIYLQECVIGMQQFLVHRLIKLVTVIICT